MTDNSPPIAPHFTIRNSHFDAKPLEVALYLVATPIGHLSDISLRALETLASANILACEDTRTTRKLLDRYGIKTQPIAYHEHNADYAGQKILDALANGKSVALVSDAGTPLISDPGYRIATLAIEQGYPIVPIPGPSAPITALMAAGLPTDSFFFGGFLPTKEKARCDRLRSVKDINASLIFFDSPHRITDTLQLAQQELGGERLACVGRELTKSHEEFARGTLSSLASDFKERHVKGEIVLIIAPPAKDELPKIDDIEPLLITLASDMATGKAATKAAQETGLPRKIIYDRLLELKKNSDKSS